MSIINVLKKPSVWSPAYNPILWMVDSDQTTQYKFRYVFDVYIYGKSKIRFKVPPNPQGIGIINVQTLVAGELNIAENLPFLSDLPFYFGEGLATTVYILAGEEYTTTPTGVTTIFNGSGTPGEPAYALYADGDWRPCPNNTTPVVAWASGQGSEEWYNYNATSGENILAYEMDLPSPSPVEGKFLTRCPYTPQSIRSDEDFTLSWLNWNFETASLYGEVPYSMRKKFYDNNTVVGYSDTLFTTANGGTGWSSCSSWTGVTGDNYWLYNFKLNTADTPATVTRTQEDLFTNWGTPTVNYFPVGEIFPGYIDTDLTPPMNFDLVNDDEFLNDDHCLSVPAVNGDSALVFQEMFLPAGSVIDFVIPSQNAWGTNYPELHLWGCTSPDVNDGANWSELNQFSIAEDPGGDTEYSINDTTGPTYYALGLRMYAGVSGDPCSSIGPFATPGSYITVTSPFSGVYDKVCLDLHKYDDYASCTIDPVPISETICLEINDDNCWGFEPIRFTWLNNSGGRDWFTFIKRNTNVQNASRSTMYRVPGYWSTDNFNVGQLNPSRYGTTVYNMDLVNTWTASTDWISDEQSEWLRTMFASPSVFVYLPGRTQPTAIIITDASYSVQTIAREKLSQYFVSFTEAHPDIVQQY